MKTQSFIHSFRIIGNRSNMADRMVRIDSFEKLNYLKESYQRNAETYITYIVIKGYIGWMEQDPTIKNLNFFSLNGDISDGTFVVIVSQDFCVNLKPFSSKFYLFFFW